VDSLSGHEGCAQWTEGCAQGSVDTTQRRAVPVSLPHGFSEATPSLLLCSSIPRLLITLTVYTLLYLCIAFTAISVTGYSITRIYFDHLGLLPIDSISLG